MKFLTAAFGTALLFMAGAALAGQNSQINIDVGEGGPIAIGGSANGVLVDLAGDIIVPVQVTTTCQTAPAVAWIVAKAQIQEQGPVLRFSIQPTQETWGSACEQAWLQKQKAQETTFPLFAGNARITADQGPLKGLTVLISSELGQTLPEGTE